MLPDRFNRMLSVIKAIESTKRTMGQKQFSKLMQETFGQYFKTPLLQAKAIVQRSRDVL